MGNRGFRTEKGADFTGGGAAFTQQDARGGLYFLIAHLIRKGGQMKPGDQRVGGHEGAFSSHAAQAAFSY